MTLAPIQQVRQLLEQTPSSAAADLAQMRANMDAMADAFPPPPDGVSVTPAEAGGVPGEWVRAPEAKDDCAVLYLHGGGYTMGSPRTHRCLTARLSRAARAPVLSLDYRLAPEHPHPAAVDDALAAWRWLCGQKPASRLAISGDSAGGGLTMALLLAARDSGADLPAAAAPISPWADLTGESETIRTRADVEPMITLEGLQKMADHYAGPGGDVRGPLVSPIFADLAGLPPLLVQVGDCEVLLGDSQKLDKNAKAAGVDCTLEVWPEMIHVWHIFHFMLPEGEQALDRIGGFFREKWPPEGV